MKLNHTGHEVYKCARVAGHTKKFVFQWFNSCYRPFVFHLCIILYNFLVCNVLLNLYVLHGQFSVTISSQKAVSIKQKYLLGYLFVFLRPLSQFFKGSELYIFFHILILHCTVVLVYKIKNNDDFIIFSIYPDFSFHNLSNAQYWRQLNKVFREEY